MCAKFVDSAIVFKHNSMHIGNEDIAKFLIENGADTEKVCVARFMIRYKFMLLSLSGEQSRRNGNDTQQ